jgi:hypothetical protein
MVSLYNGDQKFIGRVTSELAWNLLSAAFNDDKTELGSFIRDGVTDEGHAVLWAIDTFLREHPEEDPDLVSALQQMRVLLERAGELAMLESGTLEDVA